MKNSASLGINDFYDIKRNLEKINFSQIGFLEFKSDFERLGLRAPKKITGREIGFKYEIFGLTVIVWTTFDAKNLEFRKVGTDAGWVLIKKGDRVLYWSGPIHRKDNFVRRILACAFICKYRLDNLPNCQICKHRMEIAKGKGFRSRYFNCPNWLNHPDRKKYRLDWDFSIDKEKMPKAYKFIMERRKQRERQRKKMISLGKETDTKAKSRKRWVVGNPLNVV